jgi:hypothetical protein
VLETSDEIVYSKHRNVSTGLLAPVLGESGAGFDAREVDSPAVTIANGRPAGDKFLLYYEALDGSERTTIGLVTSDEEDFAILTVNRTQVVGLGTNGSPYEFGATDPTVVVDDRPAEVSRRYKMWFEGRGGANGASSTIVHATSPDGVNWTGFSACTGLSPSFGSVRVADPTVALDGDVFRMWIEAVNSSIGVGADGPGVIGYAESTDGVAWIVSDAAGNTDTAATPVFGPGPSGRFDAYSVNAPSVVIDESVASGVNGRFKLWYEAGDKANDVQNTIGYATSPNGLQWNRLALPILAPSSDLTVPLPFDSGDLEHPAAALISSIAPSVEGHFLLWYTGDGEGGASPNRIGLASGRAGP